MKKQIKVADAIRAVLANEPAERIYTVSDMVMEVVAWHPRLALGDRRFPLLSRVAGTLAEMRGFGDVELVDRASGPRYRKAAVAAKPRRYASGVRPSKHELAYKSLRDEMNLPEPAPDRLAALEMQVD